jgi:hypothetical protein
MIVFAQWMDEHLMNKAEAREDMHRIQKHWGKEPLQDVDYDAYRKREEKKIMSKAEYRKERERQIELMNAEIKKYGKEETKAINDNEQTT